MKSGWVTKKLGEVCEIIYGYPFNSQFFNDKKSGLPVIRIRDVVRGYSETYTTESCDRKYRVSFGDVLIGMDGDFNVATWKSSTALLNQRVCKLESGEKATNRYLRYVLPIVLHGIWERKLFTTVKHLSAKDLNNISLDLPPLSEQKRIVKKIDAAFEKIDALKANAEKNLANAKELFQSALDEAMRPKKGWVEKRLGEVCDVLAGYPFKGNAFSSDGIKICGGLIISPNEIKWNECKYWKSSEGLEDFLLEKNDIVIALDRPWISDGFKIGMIKECDLPCLLIQRTARLRSKQVVPKFLFYLLQRPSFKDYCTFSGATVPHISHKDIESYVIPCPAISVQRAIVKQLDTIIRALESLQRNYTQQIADCVEMRQAILHEAFEGRL